MAEVYGEKPKLFSKEWWPYYWMYYKWHTIVLSFVGIMIIVGLTDCAKKVSPDLGIIYCTKSHYNEVVWETITEDLTKEIADINGDEKLHISFMPIQFIDDEQYAEQNYAMSLKYTTSFSEKSNYIYICDKSMAEINILTDNKNIPSQPVDNWLNTDISGYDVIYGADNQTYAVSLKNSKLLRNAGIDSTDLYIYIKNDINSPYKDEQVFENALIIANKLLE